MNSTPLLVFVSESERSDLSIPNGITRIGRSSFNDVVTNDSNISKSHCILIRTSEGVRVYDLKSRNGSWIGKKETNGQLLQDGDEIILGKDYRLMYHGTNGQPSVFSSDKQENTQSYLVYFIVLFTALLVTSAGYFFQNDNTSKIALLEKNLLEKNKEINERLVDALEKITNLEKQLALTKEAKQKEEQLREIKQQQLAREKIERNKLNSQLQQQRQIIRDLREKTVKQSNNKNEETSKELENNDDIADDTKEDVADEITEEITKTKVQKNKEDERSSKKIISLDKRDLDKLTKKLIRVVENYAFPSISPDNLDPMLMSLATLKSKPAAIRLVKVYRHSQKLLKDLDENLVFLQKRKDKLLKIASQNKDLGKQTEQYQRLLELSDKKIEIQQKQRERLIELRNAIINDLSSFTTKEAILFFISIFRTTEPILGNVLLDAFSQAKSNNAVPMLIKNLSTKNKQIRQKIMKTLTAITGKNLPDKKSWQSENK